MPSKYKDLFIMSGVVEGVSIAQVRSRLRYEIKKEMSHVYLEEVIVWNNSKMFGCQAQMFHFKSFEQSLQAKNVEWWNIIQTFILRTPLKWEQHWATILSDHCGCPIS